MEGKEIIKEYNNEDITVIWKPKTCIHSKKCWKDLIQVFDPRKKPWVNMEGATTAEIKIQIEACPSGALSYRSNKAGNQEEVKLETKVEALENGPLLVYGTLNITNSDGTTDKRNKTTAFCRCGASQNKPYCDGAHVQANFKG
jgi:uncharacterized Fe-S cluster protein YjdI